MKRRVPRDGKPKACQLGRKSQEADETGQTGKGKPREYNVMKAREKALRRKYSIQKIEPEKTTRCCFRLYRVQLYKIIYMLQDLRSQYCNYLQQTQKQ